MIAIDKSPTTLLIDFFQNVYRPMRMADSNAHSVSYYTVAINRLGRYLNRVPTLADLTEDNLSGFMLAGLREPLSPVTINGNRRILCTLWRFAKLKKFPLVADQDLLSVDKLKEPKRHAEAWSPEEMQSLLEAAKLSRGRYEGVKAERWWPMLLMVLYDTGLRRSAAMAIRFDEIDFHRHLLRIPAERMKNRIEQYFRLHPQTIQAIIDSTPPDRTKLFPWPFDHHTALYDRFRYILRLAGLPIDKRNLFHKIRRTTATHIAVAAGEAAAIMQMGHRDASTIKRYVDLRFTNQHDGALSLPRPWLLPAAPALPESNGIAAEPVAPAEPERPLPVVGETTLPVSKPIGSGRPSSPGLLETMRHKHRLTGSDVRQMLRALQIPPVDFAAELQTRPAFLFKILEGKAELTPDFEGRVRVALGLSGKRTRKTKGGAA